ncbi:gliding motility lipoprotein GldH [Ascidiimonas sp. W6]|uniref:gliding motility lipoprotein GldH n=1 Tax=Ascidiimonas meishanensis TaxID=3128903 RepID=UPI0030ECA74D
MLRQFSYFTILFLLVSCDSKSVYSSFESVDNSWKEGEKISFDFKSPDSIQKYNLYVLIRNDENYAFSNLYLIVGMDFPNGNRVVDTLQYEMAKPDGTWLGEGFTSLKESKLWYKEDIIFSVQGEYKVQIEHAMRINGKVEGVKTLEGIKDIGFKIEATTN